MTSLSEILIIRGLMPITSLDVATGDPQTDEAHVRELVDGGVVTESQVASARAAQLGLPFVDLTEYPVDRSAVALVPMQLLKRYEVLPIGRDGDRLMLAMADPRDVLAIDDVRAAVRMHVRPVVAERSDLLAAISRLVRSDGELSELTTAIVEENGPAGSDLVPFASEPSEDDAPIVRFVNLLISQAISDQASDIHIEPAERDMHVRYRIDGVLHEMQRAPKNIQNGVISRLKIMSDIDIAERRKPQDGRMSVIHGGKQIDLRVATLPTVFGEKVVMRILDNSMTGLGMEQLRLLDRNAAVYKASYTKPYGMILVTGPTGS
ncbi:ATPase, T2SS/T4P/T4SS family, partial [Pseudolysinimonas sp.]|uniref:GspE/PulE family protein n=1 Tax=Pseudolysinimonas sp. TaxID=2680009 RepID=UPI00286A26D6